MGRVIVPLFLETAHLLDHIPSAVEVSDVLPGLLDPDHRAAKLEQIGPGMFHRYLPYLKVLLCRPSTLSLDER